MPVRWSLLAALSACFSVGCFAPQQVVTERATKEFRCAKEQVTVEELGGNAFRVWACGYKAIYVCSEHQRYCFKEAGSGGRGSPEGQQPNPMQPNPMQPNPMQPNPGQQPGQPGFGTQPQPQPQPTAPNWQTPPSGQ